MDPRQEQLLTPRQVAEVFGVSPKTVVRWARAGKLPFITTVGGHRRFQLSVVKARIREGEQ